MNVKTGDRHIVGGGTGERHIVGGGTGERHIRERGMGMNVKTWVWKCERKVKGRWRGRWRMN